MILRILAVPAVAIVAILIFAATRPNTFHIERSIVINSSPEKVFALIDDLHNWPRWAPQDKEDSTMKRTFDGPASGIGAASEWSGTGNNTGQGRMTITQSVPSSKVSVQVDWVRPFHTRNQNEFTLEAVGASTKVTWSMTGPNLYMMKLMSVFMNMDHTMGQHFETGLANLKAAAEQ